MPRPLRANVSGPFEQTSDLAPGWPGVSKPPEPRVRRNPLGIPLPLRSTLGR